jgi:hypothetical protein
MTATPTQFPIVPLPGAGSRRRHEHAETDRNGPE